MSEIISFSWSCSMTDRQRSDGLLCRSMQCDRCKEFRENKDQAIIDMHLKEMEGRESQGLEKTAPETYLKLKSQIQALQKENEILRECVEYYAEGEIGNDLEIRPEKRELWSIPDKWAQRSMSDHYAGRIARRALKKITTEGEK